ncbi:hypothetical protein J7F01_14980 [Streptomyces sp. ISL-22]|uniref:DUF3592 domain-containing protein n=1 Tax=unclassified Streptomyces TaxID=2593676 RepID=UPI001BEB7DB8|nr:MULTISPECIES: DUF3592 domain-containing protein [unclassified Streptomyces]MBT2421927.1 hypothetical protein [Streptomyces sp. ISL-24]MBT2433477.1 hypothetical protein [Streptomyces sp. ISL-22]
MTTSSTPAPVPSVALRGRSGALWLEDGSLVLEQDGVRRRIPLPAVQEVRTTDGPRGVAVVLTAPEGTSPTVYRLAHRRASEVAVFSATVNAALPVREHRDGAELVVVEPAEPARTAFWASGDFQLWAVIGLVGTAWLAGLVTLAAHGDLIGVLLWVLGTKPLFIGLLLYTLSAIALYDRAILRRRGVTVLATYSHLAGKKRLYGFTDLDGVVRHCEPDSAAEPVGTDPRRVQVSYDPRNPDRVKARLPLRTWVLRTLGVLVFGTLFLYAGLYMVPYQLIQVLF